MDWSLVVGVVGGLGGVVLGAFLSGRSQGRLFRESRRIEDERRREEAYVDFLAAYRRFRRFLLNQPVHVRVIKTRGRADVPVIKDPAQQWEAAEVTYARLLILAKGTPVDAAALAVGEAVRKIACARATYRTGKVPEKIIHDAIQAEGAFALAARADLADYSTGNRRRTPMVTNWMRR